MLFDLVYNMLSVILQHFLQYNKQPLPYPTFPEDYRVKNGVWNGYKVN